MAWIKVLGRGISMRVGRRFCRAVLCRNEATVTAAAGAPPRQEY